VNEQFSGELSDSSVMVARVDSEEEQELVERFEVRVVPGIYLFFANTSSDPLMRAPRLYESHMDASSVTHWVKYHTAIQRWPRVNPSVLHLLARTYDYTGGYLISKAEEAELEHINGPRNQTAQCGGGNALSASVYGEMLGEGIELVLAQLQLGPKDVFYDLGSGVGKFSLQVALRSQVGMVRGIEFSKTRFTIATNSVGAVYAGALPDHNATKARNPRMRGITHCRHGYCVCVRSMPAIPKENQTVEQAACRKEGLGHYKEGFGVTNTAAQSVLEDGPRLWFINGDIGEYKPNGYDHATYVYTCSTLFSEQLLGKVMGNLRRSKHVKMFITLKKIPAKLFWKHQWLLYLWKTIRVPTSWHIDVEVYMYRFHR